MPKKRTIAVDFDGVIHSYTSPFDRMTLDPPIEGAIPWLEEMVGEFHVVIFSSRFTPHHKDGDSLEDRLKEIDECEEVIDMIYEWLAKHGLSKKASKQLEFWKDVGKPTALIYIDDRGYRFRGEFPSAKDIWGMRPWKVTDGQKRPGAKMADIPFKRTR